MGLALDSAGQPWPQIFRQLVVANSRYWLSRARTDLSGALRETPQILKALSYALFLAEAWESARDLMVLISPFLIRQGCGAEWESFLTMGMACRPAENDPAKVDFLLQLGTLYRLQGRFPEAQYCFHKALTLCEQHEWRKHYWTLVNQLGLMARLSARHEEALTYCQQVLAEQDVAILERAEALNVLGLVAYDRRHWEVALDYFEKALTLYRSLDDTYQIARVLNNRGLVLLRNGRWNEAEESYRAVQRSRSRAAMRRFSFSKRSSTNKRVAPRTPCPPTRKALAIDSRCAVAIQATLARPIARRPQGKGSRRFRARPRPHPRRDTR